MAARVRRAALGLALLLPLALPGQGGLPPLDPSSVEPPPKRGGFLVTLSPVAYGALTSSTLTGSASRSGSGFGLSGGFGFTERLYMLVDIARTDATIEAGSSYHLWHIEPLLRLTPFPKRIAGIGVAPFLDIGGGLIRLPGERPIAGGTERVTYSGTFVTAGAGLNAFVRRQWAITAGAHGSIGVFTDFKRGNVTQSSLRINARTTRANLGVSWYPTLGR